MSSYTKMDLLIIAVNAPKGNAAWMVEYDSPRLIPFKVCGIAEDPLGVAEDGLSRISPHNRAIAVLEDGRELIYADNDFYVVEKGMLLGENSLLSGLHRSELLELIKKSRTGIQAWEMTIDADFQGKQFAENLETVPYSLYGEKWWAHYFADVIPKFMQEHERIDPYEGMEIISHTVSDGDDEFPFVNLEEEVKLGCAITPLKISVQDLRVQILDLQISERTMFKEYLEKGCFKPNDGIEMGYSPNMVIKCRDRFGESFYVGCQLLHADVYNLQNPQKIVESLNHHLHDNGEFTDGNGARWMEATLSEDKEWIYIEYVPIEE